MEHHAKTQTLVQGHRQTTGYCNSEMLSYLLIRLPNKGKNVLQNNILIKELDFKIIKTVLDSNKN